MAKRDEFRLDLTANDQASGKVDALAEKVEGLNASAQIEITAEDEASAVVDEVEENVEELDGASAEATLEAEDEATDVVEEATELVEDFDGSSAEALLSAEDAASDDIAAVDADLAALDGSTATATIDADDGATEVIDEVESTLDTLDGSTSTVTLEAAGDAAGESQSIVDNLSELVGPQGLAALSAAGMFAFGQAAGTHALDVAALAAATGGSLDQASRLREVWELAGGSKDTLERSIIRANDALRESPDLAGELGIAVTGNMTPMAIFIAAVGALNSGQLTTNERLEAATALFGTKGVLILNDLQTRVGDIDTAMSNISENEVITQEDVDNAIELNNATDDVEDALAAVGREVLPFVARTAERIAEILNAWPIQKLIGGFEILGTNINLLEAVLGGPLAADAGEVTATIDEAADALENLLGIPRDDIFVQHIDAWNELKADLADNGAVDSAAEALALLAEKSGKSEDEILELAGAAPQAISPIEDLGAATEETTETIDDQIAALQQQVDLLNEGAEAMRDQADASSDLADAYIDQEDAEAKARRALDDYNAAVAESGESSAEAADAANDLRDAAIRVAAAKVEAAEASARQRGATLSATDAIDIENNSLVAQAATLTGPARDAILGHIQRLNEIPPDVQTQIDAAIEAGDIPEAQRLIASVSGRRKLTVQAEIDAAAARRAEGELKWLARTRDVYFNAVGPGAFGRGGGRGTPQAVATGDPYTSGGWYRAGEQGEELIELPMGARVWNAGQTAAMDAAGGGVTNVYNTTFNVPSGTTARDAAKAIRRYERIQGSSAA